MIPGLRRFLVGVAAAALVPAMLAAQQPAVITGRVTNAAGTPLSAAQVTVQQLGIGATTRGDGTYTILVPAARIPTGPVSVNARLIGYKLGTAQVSLEGGSATADFALADNPLQLGEVVVTGAGTTSEVEKLGTVRNAVDSTAIVNSQEQNLVNALAAKAPNVQVFSSSGDPGASSYIQIRGLTTIQAGDGQPLFVVDGAPVGNTTDYSNLAQLGLNGGNTFPPNRLLDINPDDIENVEILKGASSGAIYGSRAGQGVVLITTKKGRPGQSRYSLRSSWSLEQHTQLPALQTQFGLGSNGITPTCVPGPNSPAPDPTNLNCRVGFGNAGSWGPAIAAGTPTFDHASDIFHDGYTTDNNLSVSGGNDRTEYFLSGGYNYNRGIVIGDNNHYRRISVRANGSQRVSDNLKIGANIAYSNGSGGFVQTRNSTAGLLLGSWRTTPTFNNLPFLDPTFGLQRSYRFPNPGPGSEQASRSYDNPFFTANANPTTSDVARTFGGINAEWAATSWLKFNENLGYDYSNDERFQSWAWSNSNGAPPAGVIGVGGVNAGYIRNTQIDQSLSATLSYSASSIWKGTITVGQNLNSQTAQSRQTLGAGLVTPTPFNLANTSQLLLPAYDFYQKLHLESYFGQATADLFDQFYLTGAIRNDAASSFGASSRHNWYPKGSVAWVFKKSGTGALTYGKLRAAYGQSGTQPPPYLLGGNYVSQTIGDGGWGPATSTSINGVGGLLTNFNLPTQTLGPERVKEFEAGIDVGLLNDKADLSVTHYRSNSSDVILQIPVPVSTGYFQVAANAASLQNRGWEVTLNMRPVTTKNFAWDVGVQWARNRGVTTHLTNDTTLKFYQFPLSGGGNGAGLAVGGVAQVGQPIGAYRGTDFIRCGRGLTDNNDGSSVDAACGSAAPGTLYIGADGYPQLDFNNTYVLADPNPDWTGSLRTGIRIGKLSLGGLLDVRSGGVAYNGTKGALQHFGTAQITADTRNAAPVVFGTGFYPANVDPTNPSHAVAGPGVGLAVALDQGYWQNIGSVFNGNDAAFLEPGRFVKLREVSIGYTLDQPWVARSLGFSSIELRVAGRNLTSWNDYTGVDPETSLLGAASPVRGLNYFNNPQSRSWSFSLTLNR